MVFFVVLNRFFGLHFAVFICWFTLFDLDIDSHVGWLVRLLIHSATMCPFCLCLAAMNIRIKLGIYAQASCVIF